MFKEYNFISIRIINLFIILTLYKSSSFYFSLALLLYFLISNNICLLLPIIHIMHIIHTTTINYMFLHSFNLIQFINPINLTSDTMQSQIFSFIQFRNTTANSYCVLNMLLLEPSFCTAFLKDLLIHSVLILFSLILLFCFCEFLCLLFVLLFLPFLAFSWKLGGMLEGMGFSYFEKLAVCLFELWNWVDFVLGKRCAFVYCMRIN